MQVECTSNRSKGAMRMSFITASKQVLIRNQDLLDPTQMSQKTIVLKARVLEMVIVGLWIQNIAIHGDN